MQTLLSPPPAQTDDVFARSRFFLRQKHFSLSEKYFVRDEGGQALLFVERPRHYLANLIALFAAVVLFGLVLVVFIGLGKALGGAAQDAFALVGSLAALAAAFYAGVKLSAKRHVAFHRRDEGGELVLRVEQDRKLQIPTATFTVRDASGAVLALLRKNYLYDFLRKRWTWHTPDGRLVCVVKEDSIVRAIARRLLGPALGLLRTNFVYLVDEHELGKFDRQFTLFDNYVLDLTADARGVLDRRVALAMGVMLDTGERR